MKIIYVCPGTGGAFYCENCIRDHALIAGLKTLGHDTRAVSMYLPVEEANGDAAPVLFGAVRLYLVDKFSFLKKAPEKLLRTLDNRSILNLAAAVAGSTRAGGHEKMTVSMIEGEDGAFADEFDKSADYLLEQKPDIIFISNAFLLGLASAVKVKSPSTKIVCMLQDEHIWIDSSAESYRDKTWKLIAKKIRVVDTLYAHSFWYRDKIAQLTGVSPDSIAVIPFGIDPAKYKISSASISSRLSIGYLSRLCGELGMDVLSNAYCQLLGSGAKGNAIALSFCGGYTKDDSLIVNDSRKKVIGAGGHIHVNKYFDMESRITFLSSLSALSVPARAGIAFGGFIAEAMASGVPVALPNIGGFSEVVSETGAGLLYSPNTAEALTDALERIIKDEAGRKLMAEAGRRAILEKYNYVEMAKTAVGRYTQTKNLQRGGGA